MEAGKRDTITPDGPLLTHRWAEPGSQLVNLVVQDQYCDLYDAQASFLTSLSAMAEVHVLTTAAVRLGQDSRRTTSEPLEKMTVGADAYIFVESLRDLASVAFSLSGPGFDDRTIGFDQLAPFDLMGGSAEFANPFDTRDLDDGAYRLKVDVTYRSGASDSIVVDFDVRNGTTDPLGDPSVLRDRMRTNARSASRGMRRSTGRVGRAVARMPSTPASWRMARTA